MARSTTTESQNGRVENTEIAPVVCTTPTEQPRPVQREEMPLAPTTLRHRWELFCEWFMQQHLAVRCLLIAVALYAGWHAYSWYSRQSTGFLSPQQNVYLGGQQPQSFGGGGSGFQQAVGFQTQASGPKKTTTGQTQTVNFVVASVGRSGNRAFLNSTSDRRNPTNTVIVLEGPAASLPVDSFIGKTLTCTGVAGSYEGHQQLVVSDASCVRPAN